MSTIATEAIRKTVLVDFAPAEAFELFTRRIASWWPVSTHSFGGDDVTDVVLEPQVGGRVYEVTDDGEQDWGARARAGSRRTASCSSWQIGEATGTEVEVRFAPEGPGSRVELEHRGFSRRIRAGTTRAAGTSCSAPSTRAPRGRPETSAAARPTAPRRSRATSRAARRAPSRRGGAPAARAPAARRRRRGRPPCRRSRSPAAAARSAIRSSRSAEPSKSARRRSPEPGVVR